MKKKLLPILLFFGSLNFVAQSGLTNMSFENWTTTLFGPAPTGWFGFNLTQQSSGAQNGSKYVSITNTNSGQGTLLLGNLTSMSGAVSGGAPYAQIPVSLDGFYKTSGLFTGDVVGITGYTTKSGTISSLGSFTASSNVAAWTSFSMPFMAFGTNNADSIIIIASSGNMSGPSSHTNSISARLDLDNFSLVTNPATGIDQRSLGTSFLIYPNPASGELNIISKEEKAVAVLITGLDGKTIAELPVETERTKIDLQNYEAGIYLYAILDKDRATLLTNKFVVIK